MSSLIALLLIAAAPAGPPPAAAETSSRVQAIGVARARIVSPVRVRLSEGGALSMATNGTGSQIMTHQQVRRDGARIIDCY